MRKIIDLRDVTFLVVDDNVFSLSIAKAILRALGAQVTHIREAMDGVEVLRDLDFLRPDIAIIDYKMEPMDGIALTKAIRRKTELSLQTLPIIMLSAFTEEDLVARARDAGVTEYVSKPVSIEALYLRIEEVVLRPRQFVIADDFCGPDRRRHGDENYSGPRRRATDREDAGQPGPTTETIQKAPCEA